MNRSPRGKLEMKIDMLKSLKHNSGKIFTHIMRDNHLSTYKTKKMLDDLMKRKLIDVEIKNYTPYEKKIKTKYYFLTEHGRWILKLIEPLRDHLLKPINRQLYFELQNSIPSRKPIEEFCEKGDQK